MTNNAEFNKPPLEVRAEQGGLILQRGGEELALVKARDRFTVSLKNTQEELPSAIPVRDRVSIPQSSLLAVKVAPEELETAMRIAREQENIAYASHVYYLADNQATQVYLTNEITLQFAPETPAAEQNALAEVLGLSLGEPLAGIPQTYVASVTHQATENPIKIANRAIASQQILTAEANIIIRQDTFYRPLDNFYTQQWYLHHNGGWQLAQGSHIDAERAWDITKGIRSVVVAIADDAIDINHPDFQGPGKIVAPKDFKEQDFVPLPESESESHGTACAGVAIAAENGQGIVGVAPGCALMPLRTTGFLDDRAIESLFDWAIERGASVISCSWGAATIYFPLSLRQRAAINRAATQGRDGKGCVVVFAAGNSNRPVNGTIYERRWYNELLKGPTQWLSGFAAHPDAIAVAACTSLNQKSAYSNWGAQISVCAPSNNAPPGVWFPDTGYVYTAPPISAKLPGQGILTSDRLGKLGYAPEDYTRTFGGTSSACPVVAGVAALILSINPDLTALEVRQILQQSTDKITDPNPDPQLGLQMGTYDQNNHSQWFGYGKVNAFKAVQLAQQQRQTPQTTVEYVREQNNTTVAIPDNNPRGVSSAIAISSPGKVRDLQVTVDIEHEFLGDIEIYLVLPSQMEILLQGRTLGARKYLKTAYSLENTSALKLARDREAQGTWTIRIIDRVAGDTGRLQGWAIAIGMS
ncbi:MAG: S8 family serine peptidase [Jaaginema sp. PMC 1079.18]|nr:S8 family serine peptidase [Jaaginema sp. PMC 1080.18]MEC4850305.1 S8 family serine peptidase [Jaaginema sp. PMC 1079.18]MEC4865875.1 S8 family serine peptidase [Jaaginema sp. PMC 1078.18]